MKNLSIGLCFDLHPLRKNIEWTTLRRLDLIMFPELVDGGYASLARGGGVHTLRDPLMLSFRAVTEKSALICVGGTVTLESQNGKRTNSSVVFAHGRVIHRYDKIHLFRPAGDHSYFTPGSSVKTFRIGRGLLAGIVICYDLRFPELVRALALHGMRLLLVPARWPAIRDSAWKTLLRARAIENQIFVIGCNARGAEGGDSYAFDPVGNELFISKDKPRSAVEVVRCDLEVLEKARRHHDNLGEARFLRSMRVPRSFSKVR